LSYGRVPAILPPGLRLSIPRRERGGVIVFPGTNIPWERPQVCHFDRVRRRRTSAEIS